MSRIRLATGVVSTALVAALGACGDSSDEARIPDDCNPLGGPSCLMPWPSSIYLEEDPATATGFRLAIPPEAMPENIDKITVDPTPWNRYDGFAPSGVILAAFPSGVSPDGLPSHSDLDASLAPGSPTILLDMESGERVVHFAEVDMNTDRPHLRSLIIRPQQRMRPGTRHLVAVRRSVRAPDGGLLERPEAFQAILDGESYDHPLFAKAAAGMDDVLAALAAEGVDRNDLVVAWDFVTASDDMLTADLRAMRDQGLAAMGDSGANLTFTASEVSANPERVLRLLVGTHDAPNFLTDGERDRSILNRGADELPEMDGFYPANFAALIPRCVETAELPVPVMVFGHGLFGSGEGYLDGRFLQQVADDYCFVVVAGDWIGLTNRQITTAAFASNDLNRSHGLVEKLGQGVINFMALAQLVKGPFLDADEFEYEGQQLIDPTQIYYLGGSLGGIMGGTFMAYDPAIERAALGVPGGVWSLMIERSFAWTPLQVAALGAYEDQYLYQMLVAFLGMSFERYDPITTAARVIDDPLPDTPPKQLLLYMALEDSLVTNLATEMVAREYGLSVFAPSVKVPWGMVEVDEPAPSGLTIYDEKPSPGVPATNVPPADDNGTHSKVNERPAVLRQVEKFLLDGFIENTCEVGGTVTSCDCSTGACD
jgi:hypothetical protein